MLVFKLVKTPLDSEADHKYVLVRKECTEDLLPEVIAISYAWGSLPHDRKIQLGDGIQISLGEEWNPVSFANELAALSDHAWLWIDQVCLCQKNATTEELNISIPMMFKKARVLVLLPGMDCSGREKAVDYVVTNHYDFMNDLVTKLDHHARTCPDKCLGGVDVWLRRVWPWQEFAYANRLQVRFAAGARRSRELPSDTMTLLRQQLLDKDNVLNYSQSFICLLRGLEVQFGEYRTPTGPAILRYMTKYVEQNRVCTKDTDLVSAVAPAIGARTVAGASLNAGVKHLIQFIERATRTIYVGPLPRGILSTDSASLRLHEYADELSNTTSSEVSVSYLHGTHFARGDLLANRDIAISVESFLQDPNRPTDRAVRELLATMSLGQRRLMVRWLASWTPSMPPGIFDEFLGHLKRHVDQYDVTSNSFAQVTFGFTVTLNSPKQLLRLCLILLRVCENEHENYVGDTLVSQCVLLKIENQRARGHTAIGYQLQGVVGQVVAAGDCLLVVRDTGNGVCRVVGRVPFTDRLGLDFRGTSTVRILDRQNESKASNFEPLPDVVSKAISNIRKNAVPFVDLSDGQVDDRGAIALSDALHANSSVKTLFLQNNRIGHAGMLALREMLVANKTLESVHLPYYGQHESAEEEDVRVVRWQDHHQGNWRLVFETHPQDILSVVLKDVRVGEEGLLAVAEVIKYSQLSVLELTDVPISNRSMCALAKALMHGANVDAVVLKKNEMDQETICELFRALQVVESVKELHMSHNPIGFCAAVELAHALRSGSLSTVNLNDNNEIDDDCAIIIAEGISRSDTLDSLSMGWNCIGDRGAQAIAQALAENNVLTDLQLAANEICDEGAIALAVAVSVNQSITMLGLSDNHIGDAAIPAFVDLFRTNETLEELTLSDNCFQEDGVTTLIDADVNGILDDVANSHMYRQ